MEDKLLDFMNNFIDSEEINIDEEMFELERRYAEMFGHGVPREMFPPQISEGDIKSAIIKCIENEKDELMELLRIEE